MKCSMFLLLYCHLQWQIQKWGRQAHELLLLLIIDIPHVYKARLGYRRKDFHVYKVTQCSTCRQSVLNKYKLGSRSKGSTWFRNPRAVVT